MLKSLMNIENIYQIIVIIIFLRYFLTIYYNTQGTRKDIRFMQYNICRNHISLRN